MTRILEATEKDAIHLKGIGVTSVWIPSAHKGERWHEITGNLNEKVIIGDDGKALFKVSGGKLTVWVKK